MSTNNKLTVYPYEKHYGQFFPTIPLHIISSKEKFFTAALIDSGAVVSIFKADIAHQLDIEIEKGQEIILGGVGGRIKGYRHKIKVQISQRTLEIPVVFSHEYLVSFNLLGRDTFFENFQITFDEKNKKIKLE